MDGKTRWEKVPQVSPTLPTIDSSNSLATSKDEDQSESGHSGTRNMDHSNWSFGPEHEVYPLFCEMCQLVPDERGKIEWRETARWVKYEEDVESQGVRWSKPFVPTISLKSIYDLQTLLRTQTVTLDLCAESLERVCGILVEGWARNGSILESERSRVLQALLRRHVHLYERPTGVSHLKIQPKSKQKKLTRKPSELLFRRHSSTSMSLRVEPIKDPSKKNVNFMRKLPHNSESANILVGEINGLREPIAAFLRLKEARVLGNITEVPLPTRFVFVLLGPPSSSTISSTNDSKNEFKGLNYVELGRGLGTLLTDPKFKESAYVSDTRQGLLDSLENFLSATTILPPAAWDSSIRIEPPILDQHSISGECSDDEEGQDNGLKRTGKFFGGLVADVKRKIPWYLSDFRDALSLQCLATWLFLYFACLTPMITFGGLMGIATHNNMGTMETVVAGSICGIIFALFSGQPLIILGSTGPVLVFEKILVHFCESHHWDYLEFRFWVGMWIAITMLILVAFDASAFVSYITRFTEENFATLVAVIFMVEAIKNVLLIQGGPSVSSLKMLDPNSTDDNETHFLTIAENVTKPFSWDYEVDADYEPETNLDKQYPVVINDENDTIDDYIVETDVHHRLSPYEEEHRLSIFLMSLLLFAGTFFVSFLLKEAFRTSSFFPTSVRYLVSDFGVIIAISSMSLIDMGLGIDTPKLHVPEKFAPTHPDRNWLISPFSKNPTYTIFAAAIPALLASILIFMDQQITAVIINRKDHKLKKGCGYHLDLFVLANLIIVCSSFGLPWFVAATVESLTNIGSLKVDSESAAPGEKPMFLGIREQRLSNLLIFFTVGLSVFLTPFLSHVPMPVLYGVFLYMGFSALRRMELFQRILLLFMPIKYQPDHRYLRQVPLIRVHLYTLIQVTCLAILWVIKSVKVTAILFPLMLVVMMVVRKLLDFVFSTSELLALDDLLPSSISAKHGSNVTKFGKFPSANNNSNDTSIPVCTIIQNGRDSKGSIELAKVA